MSFFKDATGKVKGVAEKATGKVKSVAEKATDKTKSALPNPKDVGVKVEVKAENFKQKVFRVDPLSGEEAEALRQKTEAKQKQRAEREGHSKKFKAIHKKIVDLRAKVDEMAQKPGLEGKSEPFQGELDEALDLATKGDKLAASKDKEGASRAFKLASQNCKNVAQGIKGWSKRSDEAVKNLDPGFANAFKSVETALSEAEELLRADDFEKMESDLQGILGRSVKQGADLTALGAELDNLGKVVNREVGALAARQNKVLMKSNAVTSNQSKLAPLTRVDEGEEVDRLVKQADDQASARDPDAALQTLGRAKVILDQVVTRQAEHDTWTKRQADRTKVEDGLKNLSDDPFGKALASAVGSEMKRASDAAEVDKDFAQANVLLDTALIRLEGAEKAREANDQRQEYLKKYDPDAPATDVAKAFAACRSNLDEVAKSAIGDGATAADAASLNVLLTQADQSYRRKYLAAKTPEQFSAAYDKAVGDLAELTRQTIQAQNDPNALNNIKNSHDLAKVKAEHVAAWEKHVAEARKGLNTLQLLADDFLDEAESRVNGVDDLFRTDMAKAADADAAGRVLRDNKELLDAEKEQIDKRVELAREHSKDVQKRLEKAKEDHNVAYKAVQKLKEVPKAYKQRLYDESSSIAAMLDSSSPVAIEAAIKDIEKMKTSMQIDTKMTANFQWFKEQIKAAKAALKDKDLKKYVPTAAETLANEFATLGPEVQRACDLPAREKLSAFMARVETTRKDAEAIHALRRELKDIAADASKAFHALDEAIAAASDGRVKAYKGEVRNRYKACKAEFGSQNTVTLTDTKTKLTKVRDDALALAAPAQAKTLLADHEGAVAAKKEASDKTAAERKAWREAYDTFRADLRDLRLAVAKTGGDTAEIDRIDDEGQKAHKSFADGNIAAADVQFRTARSQLRTLTGDLQGDKATSRGMIESLGPRWKEAVAAVRADVEALIAAVEQKTAGSPFDQAFRTGGVPALRRVIDFFSPNAESEFNQVLKDLASESADERTRLAARERGLEHVRRYSGYVEGNPVLKHLATNPFKVPIRLGRVRKVLRDLRLNIVTTA